MTLDDHQQGKKIFSLKICIGIFLACVQKNSEKRNPPKKRFLSENVIFWGLFDFLVNKPLKALRVSASKWCINIFSASIHCGLIDV